jgi:hypothetical protein
MAIRLLPTNERTDAADGRRCIACGGITGAQIPVGRFEGCQVFAHERCVALHIETKKKLGVS